MIKELSCNIKNASCTTKTTYALIAILFVLNIFLFIRINCCKKFDIKIKNWVENNPVAIIESVQKYAEQQQTEQQKKQEEQTTVNVKKNIARIRDEKNTGVVNKNGSKIIVEFFDYNCGYCKMGSKAAKEVAMNDKDVKIIYREFPILGDASVLAAKYSIAVAITEPDKFGNFHAALVDGNARSEDGIKEAIKKADISIDKIEKTLKNKSSEIEARLNENAKLANEIGIGGTPAFVIGEEFIGGYIDAETMKSKLK